MSNRFWNPIEETCGFILKDGTVIEVANIHPDPTRYFRMSESEIEKHLPEIDIFWHSHPNGNLNLSLSDYFSFTQYPDHKHRIYGFDDKYAEYYVRRGFVMRELV